MSTSGIVAGAGGDGSRLQHRAAGTRPPRPGTRSCCCPSFVIYFISAFGETNRAPFDLPEAESELVAGLHTEYCSLKFAALLARRVRHMVTSRRCAPRCSWAAGGRRGRSPLGPAPTTAGGRCSGSSPRSLLMLFVFVWLRGTLPRLRYDQFMRLRLEGAAAAQPGLDPAARRPAGDPATTGRTAAPAGCVIGGVGWSTVLLVVAALAGRRSRSRRRPLGRAGRGPAGRAASRCRRWTCRCRRARGPSGWWPSGSRPTSAATPTSDVDDDVRREGGADVGAITDSVKGFGVTFAHMFRKVVTTKYPFEHPVAGAALPRPAHPQPAPGRAGEVHRLRAVRLGLPGRRDLRRGRRQHRRRSGSRRASGTPRSTRSTTPGASSVDCASRPARPVR